MQETRPDPKTLKLITDPKTDNADTIQGLS